MPDLPDGVRVLYSTVLENYGSTVAYDYYYDYSTGALVYSTG
jgi:hypothetical protein